MSEKSLGTVRSVLLSTLKPIASMMLRLGISYKDFDEIAQTAFVSVATREYGVRGRPANVSRVSLMTGLTRKAVRRIESTSEPVHAKELGATSLPAEVLNLWHTDFRFCITFGKPKPLSWDEGPSSFCELVRSCSRSVSPITVRSELLRVGAIAEAENGSLMASRRSFVPASAVDRLIQGLQYGLRPLARTVAHNASTEDSSRLRFQRLVWSYSLPPEERDGVETLVTQRLKEFSQEIDDLLSEANRSVADEERGIVGVGVYWVEDDRENFLP